MDQPVEKQSASPGRSIASTLIVLGTLGFTGAAAWLYFRAREPKLDERTWDRLQPRGKSRP
jgi:hypothetical protein